jgi:hypothetical protein
MDEQQLAVECGEGCRHITPVIEDDGEADLLLALERWHDRDYPAWLD